MQAKEPPPCEPATTSRLEPSRVVVDDGPRTRGDDEGRQVIGGRGTATASPLKVIGETLGPAKRCPSGGREGGHARSRGIAMSRGQTIDCMKIETGNGRPNASKNSHSPWSATAAIREEARARTPSSIWHHLGEKCRSDCADLRVFRGSTLQGDQGQLSERCGRSPRCPPGKISGFCRTEGVLGARRTRIGRA